MCILTCLCRLGTEVEVRWLPDKWLYCVPFAKLEAMILTFLVEYFYIYRWKSPALPGDSDHYLFCFLTRGVYKHFQTKCVCTFNINLWQVVTCSLDICFPCILATGNLSLWMFMRNEHTCKQYWQKIIFFKSWLFSLLLHFSFVLIQHISICKYYPQKVKGNWNCQIKLRHCKDDI